MNLSTRAEFASCPYCGENCEFIIDPSLPEQQYVEDCYVCCQPILVCVQVIDDWIGLTLLREDDA